MARFQATIDESEKSFLPKERRLAELLVAEGKQVKAKKERTGQRTGDAEVNGVLTEFKILTPRYADNATVRNTINNSIRQGGQARHIIINARNSGLTVAEAHRGLARARNITRGLIDTVRVIGDGFDLTAADFQ